MLAKLQARHNALTDERGFTLIELLVVLIIIGILLAIAVPSYLGFRDKAQRTAAAANVREAIPSAEAFFSDQNPNTYVGIGNAAGSPVGLQTYDSGLSTTLKAYGSATGYCISDNNGTHYAKVVGPGGTVQQNLAAGCTNAAG